MANILETALTTDVDKFEELLKYHHTYQTKKLNRFIKNIFQLKRDFIIYFIEHIKNTSFDFLLTQLQHSTKTMYFTNSLITNDDVKMYKFLQKHNLIQCKPRLHINLACSHDSIEIYTHIWDIPDSILDHEQLVEHCLSACRNKSIKILSHIIMHLQYSKVDIIALNEILITCLIYDNHTHAKQLIQIIKSKVKQQTNSLARFRKFLGICVLYDNFEFFKYGLNDLELFQCHDTKHLFNCLCGSLYVKKYIDLLHEKGVNLTTLAYIFANNDDPDTLDYLVSKKIIDLRIFENKSKRNSNLHELMIQNYNKRLLLYFIDKSVKFPKQVVHALFVLFARYGNESLFKLFIDIYDRVPKKTQKECIFYLVKYDQVDLLEYVMSDLLWNLEVNIYFERRTKYLICGNHDIAANTNILILAVKYGVKEIVELLLEEGNNDPTDFHFQALIEACYYDKSDILELLLLDERILQCCDLWIKPVLNHLVHLMIEEPDEELNIYYENSLLEFYTYINDIPTKKIVNDHDNNCIICLHDCNLIGTTIFECTQCHVNCHFTCMVRWLLNCCKDLHYEISGTCPKCRLFMVMNDRKAPELFQIFNLL